MTTAAETTGSRTAGYVVAGLVATIPVWMVLSVVLGTALASTAVVVAWCCGSCSLLKKRQDDPSWDRRPLS